MGINTHFSQIKSRFYTALSFHPKIILGYNIINFFTNRLNVAIQVAKAIGLPLTADSMALSRSLPGRQHRRYVGAHDDDAEGR